MSNSANDYDADKVEDGVRLILEGVGEDPGRDGLKETPRRVAEMFREIFSGLHEDPDAVVDAVFDVGHDEMIMVRDIPLYSLCVPSKQLVNAVGGAKRAADVRAGDELWALDDDGALARTTVVSTAWRRTNSLVEIEVGGRTLRLTPEHPVETPDGWRGAGSLRPGDKVMGVRPRSFNQVRYSIREGYALGYAIGLIGADGSIQDGRRVSVVVNNVDIAEKFAYSLEQSFGLKRPVEPVDVPSGFLKTDVPMYRVRFVSRHLGTALLHWFGGSKATREFHFPAVVLRSREMMQGFLDGYCDGDGYQAWGYRGHRYITSSNRLFAEELAAVLQTKLRTARPGMWHIYVSKHWDRQDWYGRRGFQPSEIPLVPPDGEWSEVSGVRRVSQGGKKPFRVYSFECRPYPTFLVSGVHVHNCEHHLVPFTGKAHVAYVPGDDGRITGLSKLARVVDVLARRPQVQERMTTQIADVLERVLKPKGVFVVLEAEHLCMSMRGVKKPGTQTVTSAVRGVFRSDPRTRGEAMGLLREDRA